MSAIPIFTTENERVTETITVILFIRIYNRLFHKPGYLLFVEITEGVVHGINSLDMIPAFTLEFINRTAMGKTKL